MSSRKKHTLKHIALLIIIYITAPPTTALSSPSLPEDKSKAVILAYHRIGEDAYPDTNLRLSQFIEHVHEFEHGGYNILPLEEILSATKNKRPLPPKTIAITFEGAYMSAWYNAIPVLLKRNIPFTVFYASNKADQKQPGYMGWNLLKKIAVHKQATLAVLPAIYNHTTHENADGMLKSINKARQRFRENFAYEAPYLAYPFGEYNQTLKSLAQKQGFKAAFGLHSGVLFSNSDPYAIPRFSMTEDYADIERLRLISNALPLPIMQLEPETPDLTNRALNIGFTLPTSLENKTDKLSCFLSGHGKTDLEILGTRIEVRPNDPESSTNQDTKMRLNCTIPETGENKETPQWRWLGLLFHRNPNPQQGEPQEPREQNAEASSLSPSLTSP